MKLIIDLLLIKYEIMSVYTYYDYREALTESLRKKKIIYGNQYSFKKMAEAACIQNTYLSGVTKLKLHLNPEQFFACLSFLKLDTEEISFLMDLHAWQRASKSLYKKTLFEKVEKSRRNALKTEANVELKTLDHQTTDLKEFYLDPLCMIVHMFLTIEKYRLSPSSISRELGVSARDIVGKIEVLDQLGLVSYNGTSVTQVNQDLHLSESSPIFSAYRNLMRSYSLHKTLTRSERNYGFSVLFSSDEETFFKVRQEFLKFLGTVRKMVVHSESQRVFQLNFDLFDWHSS